MRTFTLITVITCVMLAGWTSVATARPIDDGLQYSQPAELSASSSGGASDSIVPIVLGGGVLLVGIATAGHVYRARTHRRVIA